MTKENKDSRLVPILREGVAVIQMIFFKSLKPVISKKHPELDATAQTMLTGALVNEVFGSHNTEEKFLAFHKQHRGTIEQELMALATELPQLVNPLADALRIQALCDNQEELDSTDVLKLADSYKLLPADREVPLPSAFMETVRTMGAVHKLIVPPVEIDTSEEQALIQ